MNDQVFLDNIAFIAFINRTHPKHLAVVEAFEKFANSKIYLNTSIFVINDVFEFLLNNVSPSIAKNFLKIMPVSHIATLRPTPKDQYQAQAIISQPTSYNITLKDALHVSMIKRKKIGLAISASPYFPQHQIRLIRV